MYPQVTPLQVPRALTGEGRRGGHDTKALVVDPSPFNSERSRTREHPVASPVNMIAPDRSGDACAGHEDWLSAFSGAVLADASRVRGVGFLKSVGRFRDRDREYSVGRAGSTGTKHSRSGASASGAVILGVGEPRKNVVHRSGEV